MRERPRRRSDEDLARTAREALPGDTRAFDEIVRRHKEHVLANCRYLSRSQADAEDLAQDVFLKAYSGISRFEERSSLLTWLRRIKVNHCLSYLRNRKGKRFLDVDDPDIQAIPQLRIDADADGFAERHFVREKVHSVLDRLPDSLRVPLVMCDLDGFSYEEISRELGIGLSATKMRIKRARERFRALYGREPQGAEAPRRYAVRAAG